MISADEFWREFEELPTPDDDTDGLTFMVSPPHGAFRVGRSREGLPILLVQCGSTEGLVPPRLKHLRIRASATCELLTREGKKERDTLTIIEPVEVPATLTRFLVGSFHSLMLAVGPQPGLSELQRLVSEIAEIFRGLGTLSTMTAQALWSELFVIWSSGDPHRFADAWHRDFEERWDFVDGSQRLEVKSNAQPSNRRHHFTLAQVCPPEVLSVFVVSMTVARGGAVTIGELMDRIRRKLADSPDTLSRVEQTLAAALGDEASDALQLRFDEDVARESIRVYKGTAIPKPPCENEPGVGRVEFVADLDFAAWMGSGALEEEGGLVASLVV